MSSLPADPVASSEPASLRSKRPRSFMQRFESFIGRLSVRNDFWHKVCSLVWLPYAFRSGLSLRKVDADTFTAVLPFRRINRNWYNAMAGAALLGNCEVAAGMYLFARCGPDYMVVCKEMNYRFRRPCLGPAVYRVVRSEDVTERVAAGEAFNCTLEMEIRQSLRRKGKEPKVGECSITFHCVPLEKARQRAEPEDRPAVRK
ncbi:MAG: PaaI family thioesterase [Phycisphaerales bacterium]